MSVLAHLNKEGRDGLIDVCYKRTLVQMAIVLSSIKISKDMFDQIVSSRWRRGKFFSVAKAARMMACKHTSSKSPMNHLNRLNVSFNRELQEHSYVLHCRATVKGEDSLKVELEALTVLSSVALAAYNYFKAVDKGIFIGSTIVKSSRWIIKP